MTRSGLPIAAQATAADRYRFRGLGHADFGMLLRWLTEPHVAEWWGDPQEGIAEMREAMTDPATCPMIVELDGEPMAYLQHCNPHMEANHPYRDQPKGTLGLDLSIGPAEYLGIGHGSAILREYARELQAAGAPRLIIDPDPANGRAIRAYEKAGFVAFDRRTSIYGPALMMARDA